VPNSRGKKGRISGGQVVSRLLECYRQTGFERKPIRHAFIIPDSSCMAEGVSILAEATSHAAHKILCANAARIAVRIDARHHLLPGVN